MNAASQQVESGAQKIGQGVEETAKGICRPVEEGAKVTGEKLKESGEAAEPRLRLRPEREALLQEEEGGCACPPYC
jgi:hypothetical protein